MDARISAALSAGSISSTDQTALESALDSIDSTLASSRSSGSRPTGDMQSRLASLIDQQVDAGTLTADQAKELNALFAEGMGGAGKPEGACGAGDPSSLFDTIASGDSDSSTDAAEETTEQIDALMALLQQLRDSVSSGLYGQRSGSSDGTNSGLLIDAMA